MTWNGKLAKEIYRKAGNRALGIAAEGVLTEANKTIPIEEATLERSGETSQDTERMEAAVSYDTAYARVQHEDLSLRHDPGRRAKWLEQTLNETGEDVAGLIADEMSKVVP